MNNGKEGKEYINIYIYIYIYIVLSFSHLRGFSFFFSFFWVGGINPFLRVNRRELVSFLY